MKKIKKALKIILYVFAALWVISAIHSFTAEPSNDRISDFIGLLFLIAIPVVPISWHEIKNAKRRKELKKRIIKADKEESKIRSLQYGLPVLEVPSLHLGNVQVHYYGPGRLLETENKMVGMVSRSHQEIKERPSFFESNRHRNYYSNGSEQSQALYNDVSSLYRGDVVITDRGVVFINPQKGFEVKIQDIAVTDLYNDGVSIQSGGESHQLLIEDPGYFIAILDVLRER